jgi:hypothetical protein
MRSRVRFPVLSWGFFLEGEDPLGDHGLGSLVEFRYKARSSVGIATGSNPGGGEIFRTRSDRP